MGLKEAALEAYDTHREREETQKSAYVSDLVRRARLRFQRAFKFETEPDLVEVDGQHYVDFEIEGLHLRFVRQRRQRAGWEEGFHVLERCEGCLTLTPVAFVDDLRTLGAYLADPPEWECSSIGCKEREGDAIADSVADLKLPVER